MEQNAQRLGVLGWELDCIHLESLALECWQTPDRQEKELEELRGRLRNILAGAYDEGVLEQAESVGVNSSSYSAALCVFPWRLPLMAEVVQDAVKKTNGGSDELPALKAEFLYRRRLRFVQANSQVMKTCSVQTTFQWFQWVYGRCVYLP